MTQYDIYGALTRTEKLRFKATLDKAGADRHSEAVRKTSYRDAFQNVQDGDELTVSYECNVLYFGVVEQHLRLFESLLADPELVVEADVEELKLGESLLVNIVEAITRIQVRLEEKKARQKLQERFSRELGPEAAPERYTTPEQPRGLWGRIRDWWSR